MGDAYFVYVLRSITAGIRYVGSCQDIEARLQRHNNGNSKSTKHGKPWTLVYSEQFATRAEAVQRERYFKTGRGREELDKIETSKVKHTQRGVAQPG